MSQFSEDQTNIINNLSAEVAALKSIITQLLRDKSGDELRGYLRDVSTSKTFEISVPDISDKVSIQSKAQRISRSLVSELIEGKNRPA
ncbi:hypothetical protein [Rahnella inusitata]|uniref:hypothetical protein n=1 Tax=Rahnella inusitata TaxID=58169 RepID=UPI0039AF5F55